MVDGVPSHFCLDLEDFFNVGALRIPAAIRKSMEAFFDFKAFLVVF